MAQRAALSQAATVSPSVAAAGRCTSGQFPPQVAWAAAPGFVPARPASSGTPLIKQMRNGVEIARYTSLGKSGCYQPENNDARPDPVCGVFSRGFGRNWQDGDVFEVYPAVYEGDDQQPWIGPAFSTHAQYNTGVPTVPKNITLRGVTVNGERPVIRLPATGASNNTLGQGLVYLDQSNGIVIENLDIEGGSAGSAGKAGVYVRAAKDLTLRNVRVHGFQRATANGVFVAGEAAGVLRLDGLELSSNGGDSGPEHNIYVNASGVDPNFTVWMTGSYSHDVYYGHTFKSRAQVNLLEGNYFQGGVGSAARQAEAYLVDLPEGGRALLRNNVLAKNASGANSNGALITYAVEGAPAGRAQSLVIEHNTLLAYAKTYDGLHGIYPIFTPYQTATGSAYPFAKVSVNHNALVGFCGTTGREAYFGDAPWLLDFADLNADFSPKAKTVLGNPAVVGRPGYVHRASRSARRSALAGALD